MKDLFELFSFGEVFLSGTIPINIVSFLLLPTTSPDNGIHGCRKPSHLCSNQHRIKNAFNTHIEQHGTKSLVSEIEREI